MTAVHVKCEHASARPVNLSVERDGLETEASIAMCDECYEALLCECSAKQPKHPFKDAPAFIAAAPDEKLYVMIRIVGRKLAEAKANNDIAFARHLMMAFISYFPDDLSWKYTEWLYDRFIEGYQDPAHA